MRRRRTRSSGRSGRPGSPRWPAERRGPQGGRACRRASAGSQPTSGPPTSWLVETSDNLFCICSLCESHLASSGFRGALPRLHRRWKSSNTQWYCGWTDSLWRNRRSEGILATKNRVRRNITSSSFMAVLSLCRTNQTISNKVLPNTRCWSRKQRSRKSNNNNTTRLRWMNEWMS